MWFTRLKEPQTDQWYTAVILCSHCFVMILSQGQVPTKSWDFYLLLLFSDKLFWFPQNPEIAQDLYGVGTTTVALQIKIV